MTKRDLLAPLLLLLLVLAAAVSYRHFTPDDAFITYRYAANLAAGSGLVYNPGERVLGTTTPLFALLLGGLTSLTGLEPPALAAIISWTSLLGAGFTLYFAAREDLPRLAWIVAALMISYPLLLMSVGMETFLFVFLLCLSLQAYCLERNLLASVCLGLLILTRHEGMLVAGILALDWIRRHRRVPEWMIPTAGLIGVWLIFAWVYFGSPIPHSAVAKLAAPRTPFLLGLGVYWTAYSRIVPLINVQLVLALFGLYAIVRHRGAPLPRFYRLILVWSGSYFLTAAYLAGSFPWYYAPLLPGMAILIGAGIAALSDAVRLLTDSRRLEPAITARMNAALMIGIAAILLAGNIRLWWNTLVMDWTLIRDRRHRVYREMAAWIGSQAEPGETVASPEIGVLGYYLPLPIIDLHGLVTPDLAFLPGQDPLRAALEYYRPDYLIILPGWDTQALKDDYRFVAEASVPTHSLYRRHD
jgi:hypothetical protein